MPAVTAARVTVIPAKKDRLPINLLSNEARKLRVAAYARVSTNNEEQLTSYEAQVDYSGCYARVSVNFYAFNSNGNRGIACGLGNIQKVRDGEPLGGRSSAADDFSTDFDDDFLS